MVADRGVVASVGDERPVDEVPVDEEGTLQSVDGRPLKAQMGVAPGGGCLFCGAAFDVASGDVHTSDVASLSVDDVNLTVVAVVHLAGESRKLHGHEGVDVDACLAHTLKEVAVYLPAAYIVVDDAHLHTLSGPVDESVGDEVAQFVVGKDVGVYVDVMFRVGDVAQERVEHLIAVGEDADGVVFEGEGPVLQGELLDERAAFVGDDEVLLLYILKHGSFGELVEAVL